MKYDIISKSEDKNNIYYKVCCDKKKTDFQKCNDIKYLLFQLFFKLKF